MNYFITGLLIAFITNVLIFGPGLYAIMDEGSYFDQLKIAFKDDPVPILLFGTTIFTVTTFISILIWPVIVLLLLVIATVVALMRNKRVQKETNRFKSDLTGKE